MTMLALHSIKWGYSRSGLLTHCGLQEDSLIPAGLAKNIYGIARGAGAMHATDTQWKEIPKTSAHQRDACGGP